jgi:hypothetical protein
VDGTLYPIDSTTNSTRGRAASRTPGRNATKRHANLGDVSGAARRAIRRSLDRWRRGCLEGYSSTGIAAKLKTLELLGIDAAV